MADSLSEASWKAFTKRHKLEIEDKALVKALAAFDKTDPAKPEPRLHALESLLSEAGKQVVALARVKKTLGDELFDDTKSKLYEVIDEAERLSKAARKSAEEAAKQGGDDDDEADTPALLTTKMLPLIRTLRGDAKGEVRMHGLIGTAGKETAVLIMRRPIATSRRKLLGEAMDAKGGAKFYPAECLLEQGAITFIVQGQAAGLAKRVRAALLKQLELRLKVRVRGEAPGDVDETEDESTEEVRPEEKPPANHAFTARLAAVVAQVRRAKASGHEAAQAAQAQVVAAGALAEKGDFGVAAERLTEAEGLLSAPACQEDDKLRRQWELQLAAVTPRVEAVLAGVPANAGALRAVLAYAQGAAEKGDYAKAMDALKRLVEQLVAAHQGPRDTDVIPEGIVKQRVAQLEQLNSRWKDVRFQSIEGLSSLIQRLRSEEDPDLHTIADRVDVLTRQIPGDIDTALRGLSASVQARDTAAIRQGVTQVTAGIERCEAYLEEHLSAIENCEQNPFDDAPVAIQQPVRETLAAIRAHLAGL